MIGISIWLAGNPPCWNAAIELTYLFRPAEQECRLTETARGDNGLAVISPSGGDNCALSNGATYIRLYTFGDHDTKTRQRYCFLECAKGWYRLAGFSDLKLACIPQQESAEYGLLNTKDIACTGTRFVSRGGLHVACRLRVGTLRLLRAPHHYLHATCAVICSANVQRKCR